MKLVWVFSDSPGPDLTQVGGKGLSLIRMFHAGLAVPPGFVLVVDFFEPWFAELEKTEAWSAFVRAAPNELDAPCAALKLAAEKLSFDSKQAKIVEETIDEFPPEALFAVRSSSPEEDLEGSSFAGGYETVLGVTRATIAQAVRRAFQSCLDVRVAIYKREHGFDLTRPRIAVVVQQQIRSDVAGVGFSVNPISNAYDEAVFSANWGLGETVVSGTVSPDTFVVDKLSRNILERTTGKKETSIWLEPNGGTIERPDPRHQELTITDAQAQELTEQLVKIEELYRKPMDIEWAFESDHLVLLQARPITTVVPLPESMITAPGERKRLYLDATISVQGLFDPLSVMGTSVLQQVAAAASRQVVGTDVTGDIDLSPFYVTEGRLYINVSILLTLLGKERYTKAFAIMDPVASAAIAGVSESEYRAESYPKKSVVLRFLNNLPDKALNMVEGRLIPAHARRGCEKKIDQFWQRVRPLGKSDSPLAELAQSAFSELARLAFDELIPLVVMARRASGILRELSESAGGSEAHVAALDRSLPGNVTVEMGLALEHLAEHLGDLEPEPTADELESGIRENSLPVAFLESWWDFLDRYGHRGPRELDIEAPRYREQPRMLLEQIAQLCRLDYPDASPLAIYERSQRQRHEAFDALSEAVHERHGWLQTKRFQSLYRVMETLGGLRESGKFHVIYIVDMLRRLALERGAQLVASGRLDRPEQVFDLTLEDLDRAMGDASIDVRALGQERCRFIARLRAVPQLPTVIDSRGRIVRPPRKEPRPGELAGQPVSSGLVRGAVKVLSRPDEKPLLPGEVLVARATDPGWTPLFVNAGAIVLEVGGMLQHGALVAREYGKPCVAGVEDATRRLSDGELVEVDGAAGIVRFVSNG